MQFLRNYTKYFLMFETVALIVGREVDSHCRDVSLRIDFV